MKKLAKIILFSIFLIILIQDVRALKFIETNELMSNYTIGEFVNLQSKITNTLSSGETLIAEETLIYPEYAEIPEMPFYYPVKSGETITSNNLAFTVLETSNAGKYSYCTSVYNRTALVEKVCKNFSITGTLKVFDKILFEFVLYRSTFLLNESPIIVQASDSEDAVISGILISPDKKETKIDFAGEYAAINFDKTGEYKLKIKAEKQGYKTYEEEKDFTVIGEIGKIIKETFCNNDNICNPAENYENCPNDCKSGSADGYCDSMKDNKCDSDCASKNDKDCKGKLTYIIFVLVAAAIIAAAFLVLRKKRA